MHLVEQFIARVTSENPLQASFLENSLKALSPEEYSALVTYMEYCTENGQTVEDLAASYNLIVKDTLAEQIFFRRNKRYRFSTYAEVAGQVYLNEDYMSKYMHGLALTSFLWPNHVDLRRFFLRTLPRDQKGKYLEIGPGHGFYFMQSMKHTAYERFEGVDISPTSVRMTNEILASGKFGKFENYSVAERDFLGSELNAPYDAIVMGEVLEHVEQPVVFLRRIKELAAPGAYIYITTCINSPAFDHIYLFTSPEHLEGIIAESGLEVREKLILPYHGMSLEETNRRLLPINVGYVLARP